MGKRAPDRNGPHKDFNESVYHRPPTGPSFLSSGILAVIVITIGCYLAVAKSIPFTGPGYQVEAVFENATTLRSTSPVRIAGVNVGKVTSVEADGEFARATIEIDEAGLPLKEDATIKIRPRLFLEGNFFLDVTPGSPGAEEIPDGGTIPVTQTSTAVQLDEILTALQRPDRENLSRLLDGYGSALADPPGPGEDRGQDPDVVGESAAEALNDSFKYGERAGKGSSQVAQAFLGEQPGDLVRLIRGNADLFEQLGSSESQLRSLIGNLAITAGSFAAEAGNLERSLSELAPTLEQAQPSLVQLNRTFPSLRSFANALEPSLRELPDTIDAANPWLGQARQLLQDDELGGIASDLAKSQPDLTRGVYALRSLLPQLRLTSQCVSRVLVPTGAIVINDQFSTGVPNYKDFFYAAASQAGEGANFDGNGPYLRVQPSGGPVRTQTPNPNGGFLNDELFANNIAAPIGTQPLKPASNPPIRQDVDCFKNDLPDLNGPQGSVGAPSPAAVTP